MRRSVAVITGIISLFFAALTSSSVFASASATGGTAQSPAATAGSEARAQTTSMPVASTPARLTLTQAGGAFNYVALGDSVAAGAGLSASAGQTTADTTCDRSSYAYPYVIAQTYHLSLAHLACSGAKVDEGIYDQQDRQGIEIPAQLDVAFSSIATPTLITATIGANDVRWTQFIRQCYLLRCGTSIDDIRAKVYRADLRIELYRMLYEIYTRSGGSPPRVLVSGYYSPIETAQCLPTDRITNAEVAWLKMQTESLNQAIRSVLPYFSFAQYVPLDFSGHELCSAQPWVQGMEAAAPVHPTIDGQAAIAQAFIRVLQEQ